MGRTARDHRDMPHPRPVERIELSWKNYRLRIIAAVVFLVFGVWLLARAAVGFLGTDSGWQTIEADSGAETNCALSFTFLYEVGAGGLSAAAEKRALVAAYTEAAVRAYRLFNAGESFEGVTNVCDLNQHPNEALTVDEALYEAFALLEQYGDRSVYLGPVYETYDGLFFCEEDWQTVDFDPYRNPDIAAFYAGAAAYARDPESVNVELLGDGRIRLNVSEEYLAFARDNETSRFVDFYWLTNAFIADYLARTLTGQGYTHGALTSYDGFIRSLDSREETYALNVYDREGQTVYPAAVMRYQGPKSIVYLRGYPAGNQDSWRFYQMDSGDIRTVYVDTADGLCRNAADDLICYSDTAGCAETLLRMIPLYVTDTLRRPEFSTLAADGIYAVWPEDRVICHTDPALVLTDLYSGETASYVDCFIE